jgi:ferredoxin
MILNRKFYSRVSFLKGIWNRRQLKNLKDDKLFKAFNLHKTEWPSKLYFYSPRLKGTPRFTGDVEKLSRWQESNLCETLCPTQAIKVTNRNILIDDLACIRCGLCMEIAPEGVLEISTGLPRS